MNLQIILELVSKPPSFISDCPTRILIEKGITAMTAGFKVFIKR